MNEPVNFSLEHSVTRIQAILTYISYLSYVKLIAFISEQCLAIYIHGENTFINNKSYRRTMDKFMDCHNKKNIYYLSDMIYLQPVINEHSYKAVCH